MKTEKTTYLLHDKLNENYFLIKLTDTQIKAIDWFMEKTLIGDDYDWFPFSSVKIEEIEG